MTAENDTVAIPVTTNVTYVVSNDLVKISSLLPSNKNRSLLVHGLIKSLGLLAPVPDRERRSVRAHVIRPQLASHKDLSVYHGRDYLDFILSSREVRDNENGASSNSEFGLEEDCPYFPGLPEYVRLVAGASLAAANSVCNGDADIGICWDGGRHHAFKSHASGFCYVADCVLAILFLKRNFQPSDNPSRKPRIMYLDLDLHFSDGVSQAFASSSNNGYPQVLTLSIHHTALGFFPVSPLAALPDPEGPKFDPFTLSLPLARGATNHTFMRAWSAVERIRDAFRPDCVVVQCGADGLAGDPYAVWNWSLGGEGGMGWCVNKICHEWASRTVLLGGGGYNSPNVARAWAYLTSIALGSTLSLETDIPDHGAFPLYAPSFTLDVPAGTAPDQNTEEYLTAVDDCAARVAQAIEDRMSNT